jgi:hypothetical protein
MICVNSTGLIFTHHFINKHILTAVCCAPTADLSIQDGSIFFIGRVTSIFNRAAAAWLATPVQCWCQAIARARHLALSFTQNLIVSTFSASGIALTTKDLESNPK